ncbi:molybdopterin molybdotransferase MoeA [Allorhizocola rhizosphaerae]|uniref:molybdopterin molybdotransferase MoeA n=1 Tax=Allorhizocola rhizosphaerae TaxID=1872709 RepID=UPI000E3D416F|nr:molybdopterin molybdotransferase MoeA [Allorhizocola rhizosphaerae]
MPIDWLQARRAVYQAGLNAPLPTVKVLLEESDGLVLAEPLATLTDLPAFPTSSVDGYAVRATGPWRVIGRVLAGGEAPSLTDDGTAMEIATGAMVPVGTTAIVRTEESSRTGDLVDGQPRRVPEWREPGEEARAGEELFPSGTRVNPGMIGLAASCGYDSIHVKRAPRVALLVFGDELLTQGLPSSGRVRDALGPALPSYLKRMGADCVRVIAPIEDTLDAHVEALQQAMEADVVCTTGGTMHGPVDHLHPALNSLGAEYIVNTVAIRPGYPMMVSRLKSGTFVAGLPGNPQSAVVALMSLVSPLLAGLTGAPEPELSQVTLGGPVPGRGDYTHLALVRREEQTWVPASHVGSSMLRGLAGSHGFAVIPPHGHGLPGQQVDFLELP